MYICRKLRSERRDFSLSSITAKFDTLETALTFEIQATVASFCFVTPATAHHDKRVLSRNLQITLLTIEDTTPSYVSILLDIPSARLAWFEHLRVLMSPLRLGSRAQFRTNT